MMSKYRNEYVLGDKHCIVKLLCEPPAHLCFTLVFYTFGVKFNHVATF